MKGEPESTIVPAPVTPLVRLMAARDTTAAAPIPSYQEGTEDTGDQPQLAIVDPHEQIVPADKNPNNPNNDLIADKRPAPTPLGQVGANAPQAAPQPKPAAQPAAQPAMDDTEAARHQENIDQSAQIAAAKGDLTSLGKAALAHKTLAQTYGGLGHVSADNTPTLAAPDALSVSPQGSAMPSIATPAAQATYGGPGKAVAPGQLIPAADQLHDERLISEQRPAGDVRQAYLDQQFKLDRAIDAAKASGDQLAVDKLTLQKNQMTAPWGSKASAHPGTFGKIMHGLATAGNDALAVAAPGTASLIPGTALNKQAQINQGFGRIKADEGNLLTEADIRQKDAATKAAGVKATDFQFEKDDNGQMWRLDRTGVNPPQLVTFGPQGQAVLAPAPPGATPPTIGNAPVAQQAAQPTFGNKNTPENAKVDPAIVKDLPNQLTTSYVGSGALTPAQVKQLVTDVGAAPTQKMLNDMGDRALAMSNSNREDAERVTNAQNTRDDRKTALTNTEQHQAELENDKAYTFATKQLDAMRTPVVANLTKLDQAETNLHMQTASADALVAPALLSVMVGGAGSGLRMNEAEISRIVKGRSTIEDIKGLGNKLANGKAITADQRQQIDAILTVAHAKAATRIELLDKAEQDLQLHQGNPSQMRADTVQLKKTIGALDSGKYYQEKDLASLVAKHPDRYPNVEAARAALAKEGAVPLTEQY